MEALLLPNYADLLDLFLNFLLPEHAAEIGKFCEHFLLTNMTNLVEKLSYFFRKQPSTLKKMYACMNELSNEQDLTIEAVKIKILPLLKGNQLLIDWFMDLFDRPSENNMALDEYETLHLKKPANESDTVDDEYEEMQSQDFVDNSDGGNGFPMCGVRYVGGKIMYRCKTLLPAKISFLASDVTMDEKPIRENEEVPLCIHEIRKHIQFTDGKRSNEGTTADDAARARKKKMSKKFKVCDSQTLRAHAIRLNSIHAQNGEKMSDVMHQLELSSRTNGMESPKKSFCPNPKKISGNSPKKILKSPSSSSSSDISTTNLSSPSPTKALDTKPQPSVQTAVKKVRTIIISNKSEDDQQEQPVKKQKIAEISSSDSEKLDASIEDDDILEANAWTRDEDKTILEEIKSGHSVASKEELIDSLVVKLEKRDRSEISQRYEFLLNFVTYLTSS
jgi:hypothetical protein